MAIRQSKIKQNNMLGYARVHIKANNKSSPAMQTLRMSEMQ
jgi:hypothetical protein